MNRWCDQQRKCIIIKNIPQNGVYFVSQAGFEPGSAQDGCLWRLPTYYANPSATMSGLSLLVSTSYLFNNYVSYIAENTTMGQEHLKIKSIIYANPFYRFLKTTISI